MNNTELAKIFFEIGDRLEMEGVDFKPQAYRRAARILKDLEKDVSIIYEEKGVEGLKEIKAVGEAIAQKIREYLETGAIKYYEELKEKQPLDIERLVRVEGMGPRRAKALYRELGITNLDDLEKAAREGKIAPLKGFGPKIEQNIIQGVEFLKASQGRFLLGEILPYAGEMKRKISSLDEVKEVSVVGSLRRRKEAVGDMDILAGVEKKQDAEKVMDFFVHLPEVVKVWSRGSTRSSIRLENGVNVDLRVVELSSFGAALQYFTGSKEHNIATRKIAKDRGMKLNEYGLFKDQEKVAGRNEKGIYKKLGMQWPAPELRENEGEIEAALEGKLPRLIKMQNIRGDLHCHTDWDGGVHSLEEMVSAAEELGYSYIGISDHTKFLRVENGLDEKQLARQRKEINKINERKRGITVLQGAEVNILKDGLMDIDEHALSGLDYVIAGIHSHFKMGKKEMTERIVKAIENPYVNIISHPTGRLLKRREELNMDFGKILKAARKYKVALEINSSPARLDLFDKKIRMTKKAGVRMAVNTDSHHKGHLKVMELGVSQARRGWVEKEEIINTLPLRELIRFFKKEN